MRHGCEPSQRWGGSSRQPREYRFRATRPITEAAAQMSKRHDGISRIRARIWHRPTSRRGHSDQVNSCLTFRESTARCRKAADHPDLCARSRHGIQKRLSPCWRAFAPQSASRPGWCHRAGNGSPGRTRAGGAGFGQLVSPHGFAGGSGHAGVAPGQEPGGITRARLVCGSRGAVNHRGCGCRQRRRLPLPRLRGGEYAGKVGVVGRQRGSRG